MCVSSFPNIDLNSFIFFFHFIKVARHLLNAEFWRKLIDRLRTHDYVYGVLSQITPNKINEKTFSQLIDYGSPTPEESGKSINNIPYLF